MAHQGISEGHDRLGVDGGESPRGRGGEDDGEKEDSQDLADPGLLRVELRRKASKPVVSC